MHLVYFRFCCITTESTSQEHEDLQKEIQLSRENVALSCTLKENTHKMLNTVGLFRIWKVVIENIK